MRRYPSVLLLLELFLLSNFSLAEGNGTSGVTSSGKPVVRLLVLLPLSEKALNQNRAWEIGPEILPGAQLAVEQINNNSTLLQNCTLNLHVVSIDLCIKDAFTSNINATTPFAEIAANVRNASNILGMVGGPFCPLLLRRIVSPLASRELISLFQLSGTTGVSARDPRHINYHNNLNFISPSVDVHYEAIYAMMREFHWKKLYVIAETFNNVTRIRGSVGLDITFSKVQSDLNLTFQNLRRSMKKIVFASVDLDDAVAMLCFAHAGSLTYPNYVWLFHDLTSSALLQHNSSCGTKALQEVLQGVFFLRFPFQQSSPKAELVSGDIYSDYYDKYTSRLSEGRLQPNLYANIMYDSVWAFALTLNESLSQSGTSLPDFLRMRGKQKLMESMNKVLRKISFEGAAGSIDFSDLEVNGKVEIFFSDDPIGTYHWASANISLKDSMSNIPSDKLEFRFALIPISLAITLATVVLICLLMTTVILGLFIYFRNEADIKATSPRLSYIMFLGCYLLFGSTLLHSLTGAFPIIGVVAVRSVCGAVIIGDSLGINLIFTTVLLRMLRVHRIFSHFGKTGKLWSDKVMTLIIMLVVAGDVVLILVWSLVDTFEAIQIISYQFDANPPFYEIRQFCHSEHLHVWLGILLGKLGILFVIVLALAIKTRKIRRSNFKDTKKVNIYIFLAVLVVTMPMALFFMLKSTNSLLGTYLTLYLVFGLVGLFCQLFLFLPKVTSPILKRYGYEVTYSSKKRRRTITKRPSKPNIRLSLQMQFSTSMPTSFKSSHPC